MHSAEEQLRLFEAEYAELTKDEQGWLREWISLILVPAKTPCVGTTYGVKHWYECAIGGFYTTHGQLTVALLRAGFKVVPGKRLNCEGTTNWMPLAKKSSLRRRRERLGLTQAEMGY